ncbi:MAG: DMT family transporter [Blastocatellia bacterium]|nr:DMT family transporter [Blastocatellia bacterium]
MTGLALALVLMSAVIHATWNLLAKRAGKTGSVAFIWLFTALSAAFYAPFVIAIIIIKRPSFGVTELLFIGGSAVLHVLYFLALQNGYRAGDLSLVYPLARGTGPLLATLPAVLWLGEKPGPLAIGGSLLICTGVFVIAGGTGRHGRGETYKAILYALLTGLCIAAYTIWDKYSVGFLLIHPIIYEWCVNAGRNLTLIPAALRKRDEIKSVWREHRREVLGVAILSPLSYILMLTAMVTSPVSYVAPAREVGILIGAALGSRVLAEGQARLRLVSASAIVLGVVFLAFG